MNKKDGNVQIAFSWRNINTNDDFQIKVVYNHKSGTYLMKKEIKNKKTTVPTRTRQEELITQ